MIILYSRNTTIRNQFHCLYKSGKCFELRTMKRDGAMHTLCQEQYEDDNIYIF